MDELSIRTARTDDIAAIQDVLAAAYAPYLAALSDLPDVARVEDGILATHHVWLASFQRSPIGVIIATLSGPTAHLANLAVHPSAAGKGVARRLIDTVVDAARASGCRQIDLATHPEMGDNVAIYERLGWSVTSRTTQKVCMRRPL